MKQIGDKELRRCVLSCFPEQTISYINQEVKDPTSLEHRAGN